MKKVRVISKPQKTSKSQGVGKSRPMAVQKTVKAAPSTAKKKSREEVYDDAQTKKFLASVMSATYYDKEAGCKPEYDVSDLYHVVNREIARSFETGTLFKNDVVFGLQILVQMGAGVFGRFGTFGFFEHHLQKNELSDAINSFLESSPSSAVTVGEIQLWAIDEVKEWILTTFDDVKTRAKLCVDSMTIPLDNINY